jgi:hypothetical protein
MRLGGYRLTRANRRVKSISKFAARWFRILEMLLGASPNSLKEISEIS